MIFREAQIEDITQMHVVRMSVKENVLPDPNLITRSDYEEFLFHRGKGWVCETDKAIVGFAIVDLKEKNIWALFVLPEFEGKGIGKKLHDKMMAWYFSQPNKTVWLGTSPNTRAETFYRKTGWKQTGVRANGELRFEMNEDDWRINSRLSS
jgi:GNAT superfamily N-acetyltransferase